MNLKNILMENFENSIDGITLLQEYIESDPKIITRVEFVNGKIFVCSSS